MSINFGSCIHRNLKEDPKINGDDSYIFVKPRTLEKDISLYAQEEFTSCLLNSILLGREKEFRSFNSKRHTGLQSGQNIFYISIFKGKTVFTYAPMNKDSDETFKDAVNKIASLLPYAPSTILVKHPLLHCAISLRFITIDKQDSTLYFFRENDCYPYQINKEILEHLANNVKQLASIEYQTYFAITGEDLSIPLESNDSLDYNHKCRPHADPRCNYVFSEDPAFFSHMIVISKDPIPGQTPIPWTKTGIYADYAPKDYITKVANGIFPDLIRITECERRIFFLSSKQDNVIEITGKYPTIEGEAELFADAPSVKSIEINKLKKQKTKSKQNDPKLEKILQIQSLRSR